MAARLVTGKIIMIYRDRDRERDRRLLFERDRFPPLASESLEADRRRSRERDRDELRLRDRRGGGERPRDRERLRLGDRLEPESHSSLILAVSFTSRPLISRPSKSSTARSISSFRSKQTTPRFFPISPCASP